MRKECQCHFLPKLQNPFVFSELSAVGDVCHALAVIQHIQAYYPQTEITWIVGKTEMGLLSGIPHITLIPYDKKAGWKGVLSLWKKLKTNSLMPY